MLTTSMERKYLKRCLLKGNWKGEKSFLEDLSQDFFSAKGLRSVGLSLRIFKNSLNREF